jgi:large subunit ribosomal protein L9
MSTIKVILKKDIPNLGEEGDVKNVKKGFARNFLFPKDLAFDYSKNNRDLLETRKEVIANKKVQKREDAVKFKEKIQAEKISIPVSAGDKGRLYGTVTTSMIAEQLHAKGYTTLEKKNIELKEHIKFSGNYKYRIHLYQDVYADMDLEVVAAIEKKHEEKPVKKRRGYRRHEIDTENEYWSAADEEEANRAEKAEETKHAKKEEDKKEPSEDK